MKAFVTGATGYTGREVVRALCRRNVQVTAHIRPGSSQLTKYQAHFESLGAKVDTTPWDLNEMTATLQSLNPDVVFFLIGTTKRRMNQLAKQGGDPKSASYEAVDYNLGKLLLDACLNIDDVPSPFPKYIYLSSKGVGPRAVGAYLQVRWRLEQDIQQSGLQYVIARPGIITGDDRDEDRPMERMAGRVFDGLFRGLSTLGASTLADQYRSTNAPELGEALVRAALDETQVASILDATMLRI